MPGHVDPFEKLTEHPEVGLGASVVAADAQADAVNDDRGVPAQLTKVADDLIIQSHVVAVDGDEIVRSDFEDVDVRKDAVQEGRIPSAVAESDRWSRFDNGRVGGGSFRPSCAHRGFLGIRSRRVRLQPEGRD